MTSWKLLRFSLDRGSGWGKSRHLLRPIQRVPMRVAEGYAQASGIQLGIAASRAWSRAVDGADLASFAGIAIWHLGPELTYDR